jgi:hypothetical protein
MQTQREIPTGPLDNYIRYTTPKIVGANVRVALENLTNLEGIASVIRISKSLTHTPKKMRKNKV